MAVTAQVKAINVDQTIAELKKLFGDRVSTAHAVREHHGKDISFHDAHLPDAVVFAESAEEVQQIVRSAHASRRRSSRSAPAPRWKAISARPTAASRST